MLSLLAFFQDEETSGSSGEVDTMTTFSTGAILTCINKLNM